MEAKFGLWKLVILEAFAGQVVLISNVFTIKFVGWEKNHREILEAIIILSWYYH